MAPPTDDRDFSKWRPLPPNAASTDVRRRHRDRQARFYEKCLTHLHDQGKSWTVLYDTDEYLIFTDYNQTYEDGKVKTPSSMSKPGSIIDFIHQAQESGSTNSKLNTDCYMIPRLLYGSKEIPDEEMSVSIPKRASIEAYQLDTIQWRYHNTGNKTKPFQNVGIPTNANGLGKVIINVASLKPYFPLSVKSPHRPIHHVCGPSSIYHDTRFSPFRINHYLGSWEAYSYREDSRKGAERSREEWDIRAKESNDERSDEASTWLKGFYQEIGVEKANVILHGSGIPKSYRFEDEAGWKFRGPASLTQLQGNSEPKMTTPTRKPSRRKAENVPAM